MMADKLGVDPKEKILQKYDIPLVRFSTTGSGEKQILESKIKEIFSQTT